jgi:type II secretory pathway component PulF
MSLIEANASIAGAGTHPSIEDRARRFTSARRRFRRSTNKRLDLYDELSSLVDEHSLEEALSVIRDGHTEEGRRPNRLIGLVCEAWIGQLSNTTPIAEVLQGWSPDRERALISVGAETGLLQTVLATLVQTERALAIVRSRALEGVVEPAITVILSWAMLSVYALVITAQFTGADFIIQSPYADLAKRYSAWMIAWGWWSLPTAAFGIGALLIYLCRSWVGPARVAADRFWPFSLYKNLQAADFLQNLTILKLAGKDEEQALFIMYQTAGRYLKWQIAAMRPHAASERLGDTLRMANRQFPDLTVNARIATFCRDVKFPIYLQSITAAWNLRVETKLRRMGKIAAIAAQILSGILSVIIVLLMIAISVPTHL